MGVFAHWTSNFVVVMVTPIGLTNIGGNYFWIWAIVCASFIPLTYFFGVETSGRTLEQVDKMFFDEPRVCMGLNPSHTRVIRRTKADEETRFAEYAAVAQKRGSIVSMNTQTVQEKS